jgi:hypothetical protein
MARAPADQPTPSRADKVAFASDLADINSFTLNLLTDTPDLFDLAALGALVALTSMIVAVKGQHALARMLEIARSQ